MTCRRLGRVVGFNPDLVFAPAHLRGRRLLSMRRCLTCCELWRAVGFNRRMVANQQWLLRAIGQVPGTTASGAVVCIASALEIFAATLLSIC